MPTTDELKTLSNQLGVLINKYRRDNNLNELLCLDYFDTIAQTRAEELPVSFTHTRPNGEPYTSLIDTTKLNYSDIYECCIAGNATAAETLEQCKQSPEHWNHLINNTYEYIAIGVAHKADTEYGWYWAILLCNTLATHNADETLHYVSDIYNNGTITLNRLDSYTNNPITGSEIRIYQTNDFKQSLSGVTVSQNSETSEYTLSQNNTSIRFTINNLPVTVTGLPAGDYVIDETYTPAPYNQAEPIVFHVNTAGEISYNNSAHTGSFDIISKSIIYHLGYIDQTTVKPVVGSVMKITADKSLTNVSIENESEYNVSRPDDYSIVYTTVDGNITLYNMPLCNAVISEITPAPGYIKKPDTIDDTFRNPSDADKWLTMHPVAVNPTDVCVTLDNTDKEFNADYSMYLMLTDISGNNNDLSVATLKDTYNNIITPVLLNDNHTFLFRIGLNPVIISNLPHGNYILENSVLNGAGNNGFTIDGSKFITISDNAEAPVKYNDIADNKITFKITPISLTISCFNADKEPVSATGIKLVSSKSNSFGNINSNYTLDMDNTNNAVKFISSDSDSVLNIYGLPDCIYTIYLNGTPDIPIANIDLSKTSAVKIYFGINKIPAPHTDIPFYSRPEPSESTVISAYTTETTDNTIIINL